MRSVVAILACLTLVGCAARPVEEIDASEDAVVDDGKSLDTVVFARNWHFIDGTETVLTFAPSSSGPRGEYTATVRTTITNDPSGRRIEESKVIGKHLTCDFADDGVSCTAGRLGLPAGATRFEILVKQNPDDPHYYDSSTRTQKATGSPDEETIAESLQRS